LKSEEKWGGEDKKKRLDLESYVSSLKRSSLQGLLKEIKSKFSRSLSRAIFDRLLFCSFALAMFWIKGLPQTRHTCKRTTRHAGSVPPMPGRGSPPLLASDLPGESPAQPQLHNQAQHRRFYGRQIAKRSFANVKH